MPNLALYQDVIVITFTCRTSSICLQCFAAVRHGMPINHCNAKCALGRDLAQMNLEQTGNSKHIVQVHKERGLPKNGAIEFIKS